MIFFDFLGLFKGIKGINIIFCIFFCVKDDVVLDYWVLCFNEYVIDYGEI